MTTVPIGRPGFISRLLASASASEPEYDFPDVITLDPPEPKSLVHQTLDRFRDQIETLDGRDMRLTKQIDDATEERRQVRACREAVQKAVEELERPVVPNEANTIHPRFMRDWTEND